MKRLLIITACLLTVLGLKAQPLCICRYWYDWDFGTAVTTSFNGNNGQLQLNVDTLAEGLHMLHIQVAESSLNWGPTKSFLFMKPENYSFENLTYRCWFDYDIENQQNGSFGNGSLLFDVSNLNDGIHTLHFQLEGSTMTSVKSYIFMKVPAPIEENCQYHCWFDQNHSMMQTGSVGSGILMLNVSNLSVGEHELILQLDNENLSAPKSYNFYRSPIITVNANPSEGGTITMQVNDTICTLAATTNEGYEFVSWTMNDSVVSTESLYSFTMIEDATYVANFKSNVTQTTNLVQGWNWFSTYIDITLDDLKAALIEASPGTPITIKSKENGTTIYNGSTWRGQLNALDLTQMYRISVPNACENSLEGILINPANYPITIQNGFNWIAFPFSESMSVSEAFAGFAVSGDMVKSKDNGTATYNGSVWRGSLNTLVPGQGYIYKSNVQGNRTFTFPISTR